MSNRSVIGRNEFKNLLNYHKDVTHRHVMCGKCGQALRANTVGGRKLVKTKTPSAGTVSRKQGFGSHQKEVPP